MEIVFWCCVLLVIHSYILFPTIILFLARLRKQLKYEVYGSNDQLPDIYLLLAVYNAERIVEQKINNILDSDYPADKMHLLIGSDGSDDGTNEQVQQLAKKIPNLNFYEFTRRGKPNVLNELVKRIPSQNKNEVAVFTDAHPLFDRETIGGLVKFFKDPRIGIAGANYVNSNTNLKGSSHQEKAYISRENHIKIAESICFGAVMGVYGAAYAIRVNDIPIFPPNILVEDFYISLDQVRKGKHCILNPDARFYLSVPTSMQAEYRRKRRISAGNFQNLTFFSDLLFAGKGVAFCFWSHKVIRWFGPFIIVIATILLFFLQNEGDYLYSWFAVLAEVLIAMAALDSVLQLLHIDIKILRYVNYFIRMNVALFDGFVWYCRGIKSNAWNPTKRNN